MLLYAEWHTRQPGWGSEEVDGLEVVESLKSKHDAQHFAFNAGVTTLCFSQRLTGKYDGVIGFQRCSPESSLRSINLNDERLCTVIVSKHLIGGDGLLQV